MQLLVIGMHRTGTSVVTRVLNLCGAYAGERRELARRNRHNPKGFWERRDVRRLNDGLLLAMGCDWHRVSPLEGARLPREVQAEFDTGAAGVVRLLDAHRPWVIKEPRLCVTLPWWLPHLQAPACVFTHRNPLEIARSLNVRNGFPLPFGLALWERYLQHALAATDGLPRVIVRHEELLARPVEATAALLGALSRVGAKGLSLPSADLLTGFVDPSLKRQSASGDELAAALTREQVILHAALEDGRALDAGFAHQPDPASRQLLEDFEAVYRSPTTVQRGHEVENTD